MKVITESNIATQKKTMEDTGQINGARSASKDAHSSPGSRVSQAKMDYLARLNPEQRKAVCDERRPFLIIAGREQETMTLAAEAH